MPPSIFQVLVFIHGGGYLVGTSVDYKAGDLVTGHDVVFVTLNYRVGILGFLSTGNQAAPGNYGLWDMTLALKWVKDNIASFGGDPNDVTVSGESAGGSAVGYLSISPYTKGLFRKAHPMSGSPTSIFGRALNPLKDTLAIAASFNCFEYDTSMNVSSDIINGVVNCLRALPVSKFTSFSAFHPNNAMFVPTTDGDFVPKSPLELLRDDHYLRDVGFFDRSYLVGMDNNEAAIIKAHYESVFGMIRQNPDMEEEQKKAMIEEITTSGYHQITSARLESNASPVTVYKARSWYEKRYNTEIMAEMSADVNFLLPTLDFIDAAARGENTKVWLFYFNHYPAFMKGRFRGVPHGADLCYWTEFSHGRMERILRAGMDGDTPMDREDLLMKSWITQIIADFTKTG